MTLEVAVLGTGIMGAPMARNIAKSGARVRVWNRSIEKSRALHGGGVAVAETARACVEGVDIVVLMLSTGAVCDSVLFDPATGLEQVLKPTATVVVMSSIPVETARRQAERLEAVGVGYVDAPVSGGERGAISGELTIMAGGDAGSVARVRPVLEAMGRVTHVGPVGCGQLAKIANQLIVGVTIGAVSEAMLLVEAGGGDAQAVHAALQGGFADSRIWREHGARILEQRFAPGAHAHVQLKDLSTAVALADDLALDLPFAALARGLYADMCATPRSELDHSALYLHLKDRSSPSSR